ncbi:predicted protein [Uncinocarpus reesii 1704]|uniref:Checkpoint protein RAD24-like helical bundle domain-containing protein n=1 Tax=Uncinocarpus reesii (strain UAMH 1704) TaxID=336963 RepID=C4JI17_UNCRE|nr:uncharacterized protein UREG_01442 [Uncinocarpus reesii 1704]EEP76593.1 predicted protein [Uncinocarpus reesii 1704]
MAAPPPKKRQRRLVVQSSDEDDTYLPLSSSITAPASQRGTQTRLTTTESQIASAASKADTCAARTRRSKPQPKKTSSRVSNSRIPSTQTTPASSPDKRKTGKRPISDKSSSSKSLHSFFAPATEEQRWSKAVENHTLDIVEEIEDEECGDDLYNWTSARSYNNEASPQRVKHDEVNAGLTIGRRKASAYEARTQDEKRPPARESKPVKRFLLPSQADLGTSPSTVVGDQLKPWTERFVPTNLDELAVHKKKVADVQKWLVDVFTSRSKRRVLVLKGPAGSGKTTTISLLSKALGYDIIEWKNSSGMEYLSTGYISMGAQFDDFLGRSGKFSNLTLSEDPTASQFTIDENPTPPGNHRRVILIEEFPTSLSQGSSTLLGFRSALQRYLAAAVPSMGVKGWLPQSDIGSSPPIIIIVSETLLGTGAALSDNFTVYRLLGPEISNHPGVSIIEFNPVAPTFITKALDLVLKKEARSSGRRRIPGPSALKGFADMGDIRSAIASMEFLCLRGDEDGNWSGTVASRIKKSGRSAAALTNMEKESLLAITHRESSLGIFHAVGKVVYNKREDPTITVAPNAQAPQPPHYLHHFARRKVSQVSIDDLINETGTDIQTFVAALHENYILSCDGDDFTDHFADCIAELSDADILAPDSRRGSQFTRNEAGLARSSVQGSGTSVDLLRQDEISFQIAVRGLLFSLPYPVKRRGAPGAYGSDAYKMFFPTSMRLWREIEEQSGLLDMWIRRLACPTSTNQSPGSASHREGIASWGSRQEFGISPPEADAPAHSIASGSSLSSEEVLLEYLPYLRLITRDPSTIADLERLTQFRGMVGRNNVISDEDLGVLEDLEVEHWATDPMPQSPQKRGISNRMPPPPRPPALRVRETAPQVEDGEAKLVLSDDDIED